MKTILLLISLLMTINLTSERADSVYEYELKTIDGQNISLEEYKGDVLLIVNTASECGNTPQYEGLQQIYEKYEERGFKVLGFPANNFGGQEPGSEEEIKEFCELNYGVTFPLFSKVSVKGEDIVPLFDFLTSQDNPDFTGEIGWNFEKFLVDRNGNLVRRFKTNVEPESEQLIEALETYL